MMRRALVLGGTGTVGSAVLRRLKKEEISVIFSYCKAEESAHALEAELGFTAVRVDLLEATAIDALIRDLEAKDQLPDLIIHCAGINRNLRLEQTRLEDWASVMDLNCRSAFLLAQGLAPHLREQKRGDIVFLGALDRNQSLPLPIAFAASQGSLGALTMALAKELGPDNIRVNMVVAGILNAGLSTELGAQNLADYRLFSAMQRLGGPEEIANVIAWLGLRNSYMNGKVVPVNGGI